MRLEAEWLTHAGTQAVVAAITGGGHGAWFVGGCVRDGLLGVAVDDIDITTDARPERVVDLAEAAGIKAVPTGIDHGTVTLVADHRPHEVTTLRRDVSTDGRRATVAFTERLEDDAARRDFTMNALYAEADGNVLDPTHEGIDDLNARRLRFIGDPNDRIHEDYLRILRFFRFHAWYADPEGGFDAEGLAACAAGAEGLERLSRERVGMEVKKLLAAPDPGPAVAAMAQSGVLRHTLPMAEASRLPPLIHVEDGLTPDPIRRLAALTPNPGLVDWLRLSRAEGKELALLQDGIGNGMGPGELGYRFGATVARDILLLRAASFGTAPDPREAAAAAHGAEQRFPLKAANLQNRFEGPALGAEMKRLEQAWIASGFTLSRDELLAG